MSQLNLIPDPKVLVVNTTIFLANLVVIKKFFLEPYLGLRSKRNNLTAGQQGTATTLVTQAQEMERQLATQMNEAIALAKKIRTDARTAALTKREQIIKSAETAAKKVLETKRLETETANQLERQKLPNVVQQLTHVVYEATLA